MDISEKIKYFRQKKGITINKLATLSGISQSYVRDLELGKKQPTVEYLSYICDALGITLEAFFASESTDKLYKAITMMSEEQKKKLTEFLQTLEKG